MPTSKNLIEVYSNKEDLRNPWCAVVSNYPIHLFVRAATKELVLQKIKKSLDDLLVKKEQELTNLTYFVDKLKEILENDDM